MSKFIFAAIAALMLSASSALAEYTFIVPQEPGGGTSVWAQIVATQLEPFLGEPIRLVHIPGARDVPGFNQFHNELQFDDKTIMVSHGGNGVSFLQETVEYDYSDYESVGLMNLNIITALRTDVADGDRIAFASGSGMVPDVMAITLLLCGPDKTVDEYIACFDENVLWVKGMSGGERRLAFQRGELNATRETTAAFIKHVEPMIADGQARLWFHHGLLDPATGAHADDPNYPGVQLETLFEERWGVAPSGEFYDAYKLVKSFRDALQKALWMGADNPNLETVRAALLAMSQDEAAMDAIRADVGDYEWMIGTEGNELRDTLMTFITADALQTLVKFNSEALGLASVYKPELAE